MKSFDIKIICDSNEAVRRIEKVNKAAEKLVESLKLLENIQIGIEVVNVKPKWWQFWK